MSPNLAHRLFLKAAGTATQSIRRHFSSNNDFEMWREVTKDVPAQITLDTGGQSQVIYDMILHGKAPYAA